MHITIIFDERSSLWDKDSEFNKRMVKSQLEYFKDRYKVRGYMYENYIYELLGLIWDPNKENICWIFDRDGELEFTITTKETCSTKIWIDIGK